MVVRQDDGCGSADNDGGSKNLARMDKNRIQRAGGNQVMTEDPAPGIEQDNDHRLHIRIIIWVVDDMAAPIARRLVRRIAKLKLDWRRAFPERLNLKLLRVENRTGLATFGRETWQKILVHGDGDSSFCSSKHCHVLGGLPKQDWSLARAVIQGW